MSTWPRMQNALMQTRDFAFSMSMSHSDRCFLRIASSQDHMHDSAQAARWSELHQRACALLKTRRALLAAL